MTLFTVPSFTIVTVAGGGCQVQIPTYNQTLTPDQTRQLANAVAFSEVTSPTAGPNGNVAGIIINYNADSVIVASPANYLEARVMVGVTKPDTTIYQTFLTLDQARQMSNAIASYTV